MKSQPPKSAASTGANSTISKWQGKKDKLKLSFPELTDADLMYDESDVKEMLVSLSSKLGKKVEYLKEIMEAL